MVTNGSGLACCNQHDKLSVVISGLSETSKELNNTVIKLQQEISGLRADKALQDTKVSELSIEQAKQATQLQEVNGILKLHEE